MPQIPGFCPNPCYPPGLLLEPWDLGLDLGITQFGVLPQHLLAVGGLSDRDTRRQLIRDRIQTRYQA
jgi:hypothetical protein